MSIKEPWLQSRIEAWKLAEQSRKESGLFAPRKPDDLFKAGPDGKIDRSKFKVTRYKVTLWLSAPQYVDLLHQKMAEGHHGSLHDFISKCVLDRTIPPTAARPEPPAVRRARALQAARLRNGATP